MTGKIITSEGLARLSSHPDLVRGGNLSPAVKAGPFVYISGTLARDTSKDIRGQTTEIFEYISLVLAEVGYTLSDVIKIQVFLIKAEDFLGYSEIRRKYFPAGPPASTIVVASLPANFVPGALVALIEVEAVAYKESQ